MDTSASEVTDHIPRGVAEFSRTQTAGKLAPHREPRQQGSVSQKTIAARAAQEGLAGKACQAAGVLEA